MIGRLLAVLVAFSGTAVGQEAATLQGLDSVAPGTLGAELRGLDKLSGAVSEIKIVAGEQVTFGRLTIALKECRSPADNRAGEAFAFVTIDGPGRDAPYFAGWMVASSPALSALDHPRYDVWVIRCTTA